MALIVEVNKSGYLPRSFLHRHYSRKGLVTRGRFLFLSPLSLFLHLFLPLGPIFAQGKVGTSCVKVTPRHGVEIFIHLSLITSPSFFLRIVTSLVFILFFVLKFYPCLLYAIHAFVCSFFTVSESVAFGPGLFFCIDVPSRLSFFINLLSGFVFDTFFSLLFAKILVSILSVQFLHLLFFQSQCYHVPSPQFLYSLLTFYLQYSYVCIFVRIIAPTYIL